MKNLCLIIIALFVVSSVFGQKTEFGISFNSGLFSFSGLTATGSTFINRYGQSNSGYTNNPYGSKAAFCYGLSFNMKRISQKNIILGMGIGYEILRSKTDIDEIAGYTQNATYQYSATGTTFLNNNFINFNPFIGYRFNIKDLAFDLESGFDIGYCLMSNEYGKATDSNGIKYSTSREVTTIGYDFRPRIQLSTTYKKYGLYVGYSYGLINYQGSMDGDGEWESYSRVLRFGVNYLIKQND